MTTASGDVDMLNVKSCKTNITTASGDLSCVSVTAERIDAKTVSGDMDVKADAGQYHLVTASGDMNLWTETVPEKVEVSTASGDISLLMKKVEGQHYGRQERHCIHLRRRCLQDIRKHRFRGCGCHDLGGGSPARRKPRGRPGRRMPEAPGKPWDAGSPGKRPFNRRFPGSRFCTE